MVDEAVHRRKGHSGIWEDSIPFAEGLIGCDEGGTTLVTGADQLEQDRCFGLILGDIGEVVEDEQVIFVELGDGGFEG